MAAVGLAVCAVALVALGVQASRGNAVVGVQRHPRTVRDAALDDAFYRCIDVQAHSLVRPGEPVFLVGGDFPDWITLVKGVGSWVTVAPSLSSSRAILSLRDGVNGRPSCLGTAVVAEPTGSGAGGIRFGTGADVAGTGPPPAPPL